MEDPLLRPLFRRYEKSPAQVLMRWSLQKVWSFGHGDVMAVN